MMRLSITARSLLQAAAGTDGAADADQLGMAGDLVGENLYVFEHPIEPRHDPSQHEHRVVEIVVKGRVGHEAAEGAVVLTHATQQVAEVIKGAVELVTPLVQVFHDAWAALG